MPHFLSSAFPVFLHIHCSPNFISLFFGNSLIQISIAFMCMGVGQGKTYQWEHPQKELFFLPNSHQLPMALQEELGLVQHLPCQ